MSATGTTLKSIGMKRKDRDTDKFFEFESPMGSVLQPAVSSEEVGADHGDESGDGQQEKGTEERPSCEPPRLPSLQQTPLLVPPLDVDDGVAMPATRDEGTRTTNGTYNTIESLAAIVRPPMESLDGLCFATPEEELRNIRTFVGTIAQGIGQLQQTLQRSQTQWHFNRIVSQLTQLSQELSGQVEQTSSLYSLLVRLLPIILLSSLH
jgi:hypothetical protein